MTCPNCGSKASRMLASFSTCAGVSHETDSQGRMHTHDPNTHATNYECLACHVPYTTSGKRSCWCGWPNYEGTNK